MSGPSPMRAAAGIGRRRGGRRAHLRLSAAGLLAGSVLAALLVAVPSVALAPPAQAADGDYGTAAQSLVGFASTTPTATKPESKLWFAQGSWWAAMASATTSGYAIHRLDRASSAWIDTGVALDPRGATQSDVLWNGTHLFVASHAVAASSTTTSALEPSRLYRYSWTGSAWSPDAGFPVQITGSSSESLVIAQSSSGRLWATWTLDRRLYVAATGGDADGGPVAFGAPFIPDLAGLAPVDSTAATTLEADDISTIAAADGALTMAWSNQVTGTTWAARSVDDGASWTPTPVVSGTLMSDDHLSLRTIPGDPAGRVVLVLKTSRNDLVVPVPTDPQLIAAVYTPASGAWTTATIATVGESTTRAIAVVEPAAAALHVFYTGPSTAGVVAFEGTVYEKTASLSTLLFPAAGTPVLRDVANATMNNATSSKQVATDESGVVVLASTRTTPRYWFADTGPRLPEPPAAGFTTSASTGTAPVAVAFTDTTTGTAGSWAWDFGDGTTSTEQSPTHTFADEGTYTVTLTAANAGGSSSATATVVVLRPSPAASFASSAETGTTPLEVAFTDTSTGSPTSWAWDFGDGTTSTEQSPTHTFATDGSFTVTLTASTSGGSSTASTVVVTSPPAIASFASSPSAGTLAVEFADTSTGSPTAWAWDFGDGTTSTEQSPTHTYSAAGTVHVSLTVVNAQGSTSTSERSVVVGTAPTAAVSVRQPSPGALALAVTDTSTGAPASVSVDFGDGSAPSAVGAGGSTAHSYARSGSYVVTLTATNALGSTSVTRTVRLRATPARPAKPTRTVAAGRTVDATWKVPDMRGSVIDHYQVVCSAAGSTRAVLVAAGDGTPSIGRARTATVRGLLVGRRYTCTVRAHNALGWGAPSAASSDFAARA
ncbi:MAG: PKD domain-containing protein [Candidatus Nanopelagicales bacterium]